VLQQLHYLGFDRRNWRALSLLPLAEIAWADGYMQPAERDFIEKKAAEYGLTEEDRLMLDNWLSHPPSLDYTHTAHILMVWLRRQGHPAVPPTMLTSVVQDCRQVAEAAGGLLGLGRVCRAERKALQRLIDHLAAPPAPRPMELQPLDFGRKNALVTLVRTRQSPHEADAVLAPLFGGPTRLPIPAVGLHIGSSAEASLRVEGDRAVLAHHGRIEVRPHGYYALAQGPLWVNGERVLQRRLLGGETLRLTRDVCFVFKRIRP
jgi:hypothetical protein